MAAFRAALALTDDEWVEFLAGERLLDGHTAPPLPPPDVQRAFVGSSGLDAMHEAGLFYSHVLRALRARDVPADAIGRVLDFGSGWGRIYRLFLRNCDDGNLVGVDLDPACVALCATAMPYGTFAVCEPLPPLELREASFDVVTAYSVFSHLAEAPFRAWLVEFARVLRVGGTVFFTTLKEAHIAAWDAGRSEVAHGAALASVGFNAVEWKARAEAGELLFVPTGGGGPRSASFYGETVVPRAFSSGKSHCSASTWSSSGPTTTCRRRSSRSRSGRRQAARPGHSPSSRFGC